MSPYTKRKKTLLSAVYGTRPWDFLFMKCVRYQLSYPFLCWTNVRIGPMKTEKLMTIYTHFYGIREEGGPGRPHRSFENRWRNIDILYIILKGIVWRFRFILKFSKIFWFRFCEFMSKFSRNDSPMAPERMFEKFELLKYGQIIYHFKVRDLEIPLI